MVQSIHESCMWNACQSGMLRRAMSLYKMQVIETPPSCQQRKVPFFITKSHPVLAILPGSMWC